MTFPVCVVYTPRSPPSTHQRAGHATEYARTLPTEGFHAFVVIGGDGTMFEAVNGECTVYAPKQLFAGRHILPIPRVARHAAPPRERALAHWHYPWR